MLVACELTSQPKSRYRHLIVLLYPKRLQKRLTHLMVGLVMVLFRSPRHDLDPLDLEILERAFDATWAAFKEHATPHDFDDDEHLEAALRQELIEIACFNGISDPETLRDILLANLLPINPAP
jgi:hypothetical protein